MGVLRLRGRHSGVYSRLVQLILSGIDGYQMNDDWTAVQLMRGMLQTNVTLTPTYIPNPSLILFAEPRSSEN